HCADVIARPRVLLPRLLDIPLRYLRREFHAFANPRTEPRPMRLDEFSVVAPDLACLDHTKGLAPAVKKKIDPSVSRPDPIDPTERGGQAPGSAGVTAKGEVARSRGGRRGRATRRTTRQPIRRARVDRRAVMGVGTGHAVEEFVANRLADNCCARLQD